MALQRRLEGLGLQGYCQRLQDAGYDLDDLEYFRTMGQEDLEIVADEELEMQPAHAKVFVQSIREDFPDDAAGDAEAANGDRAHEMELSTAPVSRQKTTLHRLKLWAALRIFRDFSTVDEQYAFALSFAGAYSYLQWCLSRDDMLLMRVHAAASTRYLPQLTALLREARDQRAGMCGRRAQVVQEARIVEEELIQVQRTLVCIQQAVRGGSLDEFSSAVLDDAMALGLEKHPDVQQLRHMEFRSSLPHVRPIPKIGNGSSGL